ncbi:hypothetical protein KJ910_00430 [Patescibacteria group bacterium]|nr:hypothetical protein [Patescibacteria group bacterium]MBU1906542.1 hypothetical protein [Patescibacteria group bacterium]
MLEEAEAFFFRCMAQGWAAGKKARKHSDKSGFSFFRFEFEDGGFALYDEWCVNDSSGMSSGTTTIWFACQVVWFMSYGGYYPKAASRLVKQALLEAYRARVFTGGRGPTHLVEGNLEYFNQQVPGASFEHFSGRERVVDRSEPPSPEIGFHDYMGLALI